MGTICKNELDKSIEERKWKIKLLNVQYKHTAGNKGLSIGILV